MVKTDLKTKICMNLEKTHTATWHQDFQFQQSKTFFGELWQNLAITAWQHSKEAETQKIQKKKLLYATSV